MQSAHLVWYLFLVESAFLVQSTLLELSALLVQSAQVGSEQTYEQLENTMICLRNTCTLPYLY